MDEFVQAYLWIKDKLIKIDGLLVNENGEIYKTKSKKIAKQSNSKDGYRIVSYRYNGKTKCVKVHRIVASTFLKKSNELNEVNHIDGNKENNSVNNLEWCNRSRNCKHAYDKGLNSQRFRRKLSDDEVKFIRENYKPYSRKFSTCALGRKFGIDESQVYRIIKKEAYKDVV